MIIIDGNDGTGKSTLVERLRRLGLQVSDRGLPTKLTVEEKPGGFPEGFIEKLHENLRQKGFHLGIYVPPAGLPAITKEVYIILEAPIEVSRARLEAAGKDLNEKWHTVESLQHFQVRFREVGAELGATFIDSSGTPEETWAKVLSVLNIENRMPRVGIPKGRLRYEALSYIDAFEPGIRDQAESRRLLTLIGAHGHYTLLKAKSIPDMIALGLLDLGVTGEDLIKESIFADQLDFRLLHTYPISISVLAPKGWSITKLAPRPVTIATEYPNLASKWAAKKGLAHVIVRTYGSTEAFVPAFCDIAIDVVETGETAAANGLEVVEVIAESRPVIAFRRGSGMSHHEMIPA